MTDKIDEILGLLKPPLEAGTYSLGYPEAYEKERQQDIRKAKSALLEYFLGLLSEEKEKIAEIIRQVFIKRGELYTSEDIEAFEWTTAYKILEHYVRDVEFLLEQLDEIKRRIKGDT